MANIKHFADTAAGTVEFSRVDYRSSKDIRGFHNGEWIKVNRSIEYKRHASKHICDARCINATGRIMKCECSCGGKNHGKGSFNCEDAA